MSDELDAPRRLPRFAALALAVVALGGGVAAGCGGDDDGDATEPPAATDTEPTDGEEVSGDLVWANFCQSCHGSEGDGGIGPDLQTSPIAESAEQVEAQVRNGGGAMPAFEGNLSDAQIDAVVQYVVEEIAPRA